MNFEKIKTDDLIKIYEQCIEFLSFLEKEEKEAQLENN